MPTFNHETSEFLALTYTPNEENKENNFWSCRWPAIIQITGRQEVGSSDNWSAFNICSCTSTPLHVIASCTYVRSFLCLGINDIRTC